MKDNAQDQYPEVERLVDQVLRSRWVLLHRRQARFGDRPEYLDKVSVSYRLLVGLVADLGILRFLRLHLQVPIPE